MKKIILFGLLLWPVFIGIIAQENHTMKNFVSYFKEINLPFSSDQINLTYKELPYELALRYFFKGDSTSSFYLDEVYNQEDYTLMSSSIEKKIILPRNYFYLSNKLFLIYKLIDGKEDSETFLALTNNEGTQEDSLIISYLTESAPDLYKWVRSKIYENRIIVFEYDRIPLKNRDITKNATNITIKHYTIDFERNKFVLINTENCKSKYELYQLDGANSVEIKDTDPFYKY